MNVGIHFKAAKNTYSHKTREMFREGVKKNHWICDHDHTDPPVFWLIGWFRYALKHILGMFEKNFGYKRLTKKTIESVIMIIPCRNKVKEARSI